VLGSVLRLLDKPRMRREGTAHLAALGIAIGAPTQAVETLSGGQRQAVAVARSAAFARHVVIMDEPTAALGVRESGMVLEIIRRVRERGLSVVIISHDMPHVFEIADRVHVQRLGRRIAILDPRRVSMSDTVAVMTGALAPDLVAE
jgi:fructose transport system ATP-binding protein